MLLKSFLELHLSRCFTYILVFFLAIINGTYPQNSSSSVTKRAGICFRTDDDQPISKYLEYAALFNEYNQKFTLAINLGRAEITPDYVNGLRQIQASGHEIMDHTPNHRTNYFTTILPTDYYINHPGVQRIAGNKIELKYVNVNIANAKRSGYVNISRDTVTSTSGIFSAFSKSDCYLYFPSLGQLVFIDETFGWIDQNRVKVTDFWRNGVDLGTRQNIQFYNFDFDNVHLTIDGLKALGEESIRLADYYGLERPYSWIQPGGYFPRLYRNEVKQACGDGLGFKSAGVFADPSLKVFNEYNPDNDKQFGMNWGDLREDIWTLDQCKTFIADRIAKHYVSFGHSHFTWGEDPLLGGWSGFLSRTESLIQWCVANNIPIRTYSEWADILYNQIPNSNENIFPFLNVDLDGNNFPDGYNWEPGILKKTDGVPAINDYCYSITSAGIICSIRELGGIEKGINEFEIWTKGAPGDFIEVIFKVGSQNLVYKFPAENSGWTKYKLAQSVNGNTSLNIPANISFIDVTIRCSNYSSGEVKISGMKLARSLVEYLSVTPTDLSVPYGSGSTTFTVTSNANWTVSDDAGWISVSPGSGSGNGTVTVTYTDNPNTAQRSGTVTVTGGGITRTATITQAAQPFALEVTPSERSQGHTEGNTVYNVTSNTNWTVSDDADWLSVSPEKGSGNETITVNYTDNPVTELRTATITVTGGGIIRTATLTQEAQPFALEVTPSERSVEHTEGNTVYNVTSNTNWTVNDDAEWLTVSPENGSGDGIITVTYTDNPITEQRTSTITVTGGEINRTATLTQEAQPFELIITPENISAGYGSGSMNFNITSNTNWTISDDAEWMSVSLASGSGDGTVTLIYSENLITVERTGTIIVTGGGITETITITQAAQPFVLDLTFSELNVEHFAGNIKFTVASNTNWTMNYDVGWFSLSPESGSGNDTVTIVYMDNPVTIERSGTIIITGGGITGTLTVIQAAQPFALTLTPSEMNIKNKSGDITFAVISNTSWTVSADVEWLTISPETGSGNEIRTLTFTDNPNTVVRSGIVTVTGGGITDTVAVLQDSKKFLTVFSPDTNLSSGSGTFNLIIDSNTDWELIKEVEWIQLSKYNGTNSDTINVFYDSNKEIVDRDGLISIYREEDSCKVLIHQSARTYLDISPDSDVVGADSGSIKINIESNTTWSIRDSVDWVTIIPDSGNGVASVTVTYNANIDSLIRNGILFFTADTLTNEFILVQEGLETYSITVLADPVKAGTASGGGKYLQGANVKIVAYPTDGWIFKCWKEDSSDVSNDSVYSFIASRPRTLKAKFEKILDVTKNEKELPENFELFQNYPNPFNPSTTIKYSIPELSFVTLKVYDILGNEIAILVNREQPVGYYYVNFNKSSLSSGIYFYQLKAGSYVQTKRMVMLK